MRRWAAVVAAGVLVMAGCGGPDTGRVRILVASPEVLFDAPMGVTLTGAPPGKRVTITASATDHDGNVWHSSATFLAGSTGRIDPARTAPVAGDYTGTHDTGLLWSMTAPGVSSYLSPTTDRITVGLAATVDGRQVATTSVTRRLRPNSVSEQVTGVSQEGFAGAFFRPRDTTTRRPAVLAFGGSEGGTGSGVTMAAALAARGYPALGIGYFRALGLPDTLTNIPLEYFAAALRWLARQPGVDPRHVDVYGVSRGSEAALLLGADFPGLVDGVIAASPSSVVNPNYPYSDQAPWTLHGRPIPYVDAAEYGHPRPVHAPAAIIPVERIRGPVFLLCGLDDRLWPGCPYAQAITDRLRVSPYAQLQEPGAGHDVGAPEPGLITTPAASHGGTQQDNALGRLDAWPKLLAYLAAQTTEPPR